MIPAFNEHGCLPEGIYDCTVDGAAQRFGVFQNSDRRPRLWARLTEFIRQLKECGFVETVIVDGSFVTAKPARSDIDLVLVVASSHDFSADLPPARITAYWLNGGCGEGLGLYSSGERWKREP